MKSGEYHHASAIHRQDFIVEARLPLVYDFGIKRAIAVTQDLHGQLALFGLERFA